MSVRSRSGAGLPAPAQAADRVLLGDCLEVLGRLPEAFAHLAYVDPPFNTGQTRRGTAPDGPAYADAWRTTDEYLAFLRPRVESVKRALVPNGSILLHCDWRTNHRVRVMLDELFGAEAFVNHLIWVYGLGGSSPRRFARKHDDILFYARGAAYHFRPPLVPATSVRMRGRMKKATDVIEIPSINNMARERVGYPTQKPLALLSLLVEACCPPGGLVLDPFCGSGTALVAARRSGRRWLGIDASADAVRLSEARLRAEREREAQKPPLRMTSRLSGNG